VRWTSILTIEGIPSMRHHIEDDDSVDSQPGYVTPDSQSRSLCSLPEVIQVVSKVLILTCLI